MGLLGAKVKQLREAKHWTQAQLATRAKLKRSYISLLEIDKIANPGAQPLLKLAKALGVDEDVLFEAAGLKAPAPVLNDPVAAAIQDPELRKWLTTENINSLPEHTLRAIAAIIRDAVEDRDNNLKELADILAEQQKQVQEQSRRAKATAENEDDPEYREHSIKYQAGSQEEVANTLKRLKDGAYKVAAGLRLDLQPGLSFCALWPEPRSGGRQAILELEKFYRKNSSQYWDSDLLVNWMYNLPSQPLPLQNRGPLDQSIVRLDLRITREDGEVARIYLWFDGQSLFQLLKTIYLTGTLWLMAEPFDRRGTYEPQMPPMRLDQVAVEELGKYLAAFARLNKLNEPELIARYPEPVTPRRKEVEVEETAEANVTPEREAINVK